MVAPLKKGIRRSVASHLRFVKAEFNRTFIIATADSCLRVSSVHGILALMFHSARGKTLKAGNEDILVRWHDASALGGDLRADAADNLLDFLNDSHPFVRWRASRALAETARGLQGGGPLGGSLWIRHSNHFLTFDAFWKLLEQRIEDGDARCRVAIVDGLGLWGHPRGIDLLISALKRDDAPVVRAAAANALGSIGDRQAVRPLIDALRDECLWVQRAAGHALGQIAAPESVDALRDALSDAESLVRASVAAALGHISTTKVRRTLVECLQDEDPAVRWYAARSLANVGEVENIVPLEALLEDEAVLFGRSIGEMARSAIEAIERRSASPWHWLRKKVHIAKQMVKQAREA